MGKNEKQTIATYVLNNGSIYEFHEDKTIYKVNKQGKKTEINEQELKKIKEELKIGSVDVIR